MKSSERVWRERGLRDAVLAGDEQAWRALYEAAFDGLRAYAYWRCAGLNDLADEIVQESWLVAVRRIRSFVPESGSFAGWLRGIAANVVRNHLRQLQGEDAMVKGIVGRRKMAFLLELLDDLYHDLGALLIGEAMLEVMK